MLWLGIGVALIIAGIFGIYFASQMKPEKLVTRIDRVDEETGEDPYRSPGVEIGDFLKENYARKVLTYAGVLFIIIGAVIIYKSFILEVPADKVAVRYVLHSSDSSVTTVVEYGPGFYFINPFNKYALEDIDKYDRTKKENEQLREDKSRYLEKWGECVRLSFEKETLIRKLKVVEIDYPDKIKRAEAYRRILMNKRR